MTTSASRACEIRAPHQVDIPECRTLQVHAPEQGTAQVLKFELFSHPPIMAARAD